MLAGVPSRYPSAASTSAADAVSAGRTATSTPSISSVDAPARTASNIACSAGDVVWWTISRTAISAGMPGAHTGSPRHDQALRQCTPGRAEGVSHRSWPSRAAIRRDGPQGGGGADSGAIGDDDNAAERPPVDAQQAEDLWGMPYPWAADPGV